jgi:dihydrofolate reductase
MPVVLEISMSLDGFVAGPNVSIDNPMGDGGERIHDWLFGAKTMADTAIIADMMDHLGAVILGRRTYDVGEGPWGDDPPFPVPCFVLTRRARPPVVKKGTTIAFVDRGIEVALALAKQAAGDKNVLIMGGATVARQYMKARLIDEIHLHLAHRLLGGGDRLFEEVGSLPLHKVKVVESTAVTHLKFRVTEESPE